MECVLTIKKTLDPRVNILFAGKANVVDFHPWALRHFPILFILHKVIARDTDVLPDICKNCIKFMEHLQNTPLLCNNNMEYKKYKEVLQGFLQTSRKKYNSDDICLSLYQPFTL